MYELLSVGVMILLGILGGKLSHKLKIPRVTGYMLTGLLFGPSLLGLLSRQTLVDIQLINDIALGLILFAIGGEVQLGHLRSMGRKVVYISIAEMAGAFVLVSAAAWWLSGNPALALVLGVISMATAPGVTLLVIREYAARGPLTDTLLALVGLNNIAALTAFIVVSQVVGGLEGEAWSAVAWETLRNLGGTVLVGGVIGMMITFWEQKIDDLPELLLVIIGGILLGIGLARQFGASPLLVSLIIGVFTNNLSMMHRLVYAELRQTEMPFFIAFFVLSGATLHIGSLWHLGMLGLAYVVLRSVGKMSGAFLAARRFGAQPKVAQNVGPALLPQGSIAIGLALASSQISPSLGHMVQTVVLSAVIVFEGIGPFVAKLALGRAGEIHLQE